MDAYFIPIVLTGGFTGIAIGLLGVFIVGMRMPFIGSCISHAAMVGAVYASLWNLNPTAGALLLSAGTSAAAAFLPPSRKSLDANTGQAAGLAFMMGLVFLAVGLEQGSRNEMLSLLWGNVLFADWKTAGLTGALMVLLVGFTALFNQELKSILFSHSLAAATGPYTKTIYFFFLLLCGVILAVTLKAVGGLLIFSLLVCPAAAAYQICRGYRAVVLASMLFGLLSTTLGFWISYAVNLPTGACTVLVSAFLFAGSSVFFLYRNRE